MEYDNHITIDVLQSNLIVVIILKLSLRNLKILVWSGISQNYVVYVCATKGGINNECNWEFCEITERQLFILGFKLGVKIVIEAYLE